MLTGLLTPSVPQAQSLEAIGTDTELLVPLAKECPDDVPCRVQDADLWFADRPDLLEEAKSLCRQCPLRTQCLESAMEREEPWGVWGGEIFERGVVIARKRPRGRPRKNAAVA